MPLFRLLSRTLLARTLGLTVGLMVLIWLGQSLRFLMLITRYAVDLKHSLLFLGLLLPESFAMSLPLGFFLATLSCFYDLQAAGELVTLQNFGLAPQVFARFIVKRGLVLASLLFLAHAFFLPACMQHFRTLERLLRYRYSCAMLAEGEFATLGHVTVYVQKKTSPQHLHGVFLYDRTQSTHPVMLFGQEAEARQTQRGLRLHLKKGVCHYLPHEMNSLEMPSLSLASHRKEAKKYRSPSDTPRRMSALLSHLGPRTEPIILSFDDWILDLPHPDVPRSSRRAGELSLPRLWKTCHQSSLSQKSALYASHIPIPNLYRDLWWRLLAPFQIVLAGLLALASFWIFPSLSLRLRLGAVCLSFFALQGGCIAITTLSVLQTCFASILTLVFICGFSSLFLYSLFVKNR